MSPSIQKFWPRRRIARYGLAGGVWIGANMLALAGIDLYETHQLSQEYDIAASVIRQYQFQTISIPTAAPGQDVPLWYRYRPPGYWTGRHGVPLLVYLHGSGERGFDNVRQLRSAPSVMCELPMSDAFPCAVLAPQCPEEFNWSSRIDSETDILDALMMMVDKVLRDPRIDPHRVYLAGSSMGGYGTWALAARAPDRFAAVVPIAGGGNTESASRFIDVPLWAVHGADDEVVPVAQSKEMITAIREAGGSPQFLEPAGVGHAAWRIVFCEDSEVLYWMFQQSQRAKAQAHTTPGPNERLPFGPIGSVIHHLIF